MIYLGADHAGYKTKEEIKKYLEKNKIKFKDLSPNYDEKDDYPDHAKRVALKVVKEKGAKGILVCGSGTGMTIAANRFKGIRAALAYDKYSAIMARKDNDTNIITLRGRNFSSKKTIRLVELWLKTPFSREQRHKKRIKKLG